MAQSLGTTDIEDTQSVPDLAVCQCALLFLTWVAPIFPSIAFPAFEKKEEMWRERGTLALAQHTLLLSFSNPWNSWGRHRSILLYSPSQATVSVGLMDHLVHS